MDWTTVAVAIIGFGGGAATPLVTSLYTNKSERKTWRRDQLSSVLVDAVAYSQLAYARINQAMDPRQITRTPDYKATDSLSITAQLRIFAKDSVYAAWSEFLEEDGVLWYNAEADFEDAPREDYEPALDMENPQIDIVFKAIEAFQGAARSEFD